MLWIESYFSFCLCTEGKADRGYMLFTEKTQTVIFLQMLLGNSNSFTLKVELTESVSVHNALV